MTVAAIGDIHSNLPAFDACLRRVDEAGADVILFMGDYVSDCACPQLTMARLRQCAEKYDCRFIRGNREQYMLDHRDAREVWAGTGGGSLQYTFDRLTEADLAFFEDMPAVSRDAFDGLPAILRCHGAPDDLRGWAASRLDEAERWLSEAEAGLLLCAHTHCPAVISLRHGLLVNTGTVGVSLIPGEAQFVLLYGERGAWRAELQRVPYDPEETVAMFSKDGFSEAAGYWAVAMAKNLREGGHWTGDMVRRAGELWPGDGPIPESVWERAARDVGILE